MVNSMTIQGSNRTFQKSVRDYLFSFYIAPFVVLGLASAVANQRPSFGLNKEPLKVSVNPENLGLAWRATWLSLSSFEMVSLNRTEPNTPRKTFKVWVSESFSCNAAKAEKQTFSARVETPRTVLSQSRTTSRLCLLPSKVTKIETAFVLSILTTEKENTVFNSSFARSLGICLV